jgi:putative nucleotidyltransferase with HDIG domain
VTRAVVAPTLDALTRRVTELPPLPQVLLELMRMLRRPDISERSYVALIERDQALAARMLRLANSAFYGVPGRVASIGEAVRILGVRTVFGALTAAALHGQVRVEACRSFDFDSYWRHTVATALAARALAHLLDHDADEAFLAGLLHDVGQLVLAAFEPQAACRAIERARQDGLAAVDAETAELGFAHPLVGALVARHWRFPESICRAIELHHRPVADGDRIGASGLVHIADRIAHSLGLGNDPATPAFTPQEGSALGLSPESLARLTLHTEQAVREMSSAFEAA